MKNCSQDSQSLGQRVEFYASKIYCISTSNKAKQTTLQTVRKYFSLHLHSPYLKMFHTQVRSELYIICQYFCSMSIFFF